MLEGECTVKVLGGECVAELSGGVAPEQDRIKNDILLGSPTKY